ncbi:MAG TPA: GRAM domain-containing protein [Ginsengibacter sp.]
MSNKVKPGLFFGITMAVIFIAESLLSADDTSTGDIVRIIATGIISGAIAGFLFGFLIEKFRTSKFVKNSTIITLDADEKIIFETPANHFKGAEGVGGKLYLTNKRLVFKSHKLNFQKHELSIPLNEITKVERYKALFMINNGLNVQTIQNTTERFVVEKAGEWYNYLNKPVNGVTA